MRVKDDVMGNTGLSRSVGVGSALAAAWALGLAGACAGAPAGAFRAGAATTNISPWLGLSMNGGMSDNPARVVHDELHARALVLDDGATRIAFVVCDSCMIPREVVAEAKARVRSRSGLAPDHVLVSATHAHSCPTAGGVFQSDPDPDYRRFLAVRIADAVEGAVANLAPARIGWGTGAVPDQVFNRRWHKKPGTIPPDPFGRTGDKVQMNPPPGSPDLVAPAGPTDPEVPVVAVRTPEGRPVALLANYSLHYVGGVPGGHASADYYGAFTERVGQLLGAERSEPPFVAMMSNGTSGDINNINFRNPRPPMPSYAMIRHVADALAREAVRVEKAIAYRDHVTLDARVADLKLRVRKPDLDDVERAETVVARAKAKGSVMTTMAEVYARETLLLRDYPDEVGVTVQALRIGELGVVAIPCEVFVEIGLNLKARSPLKPAFTIELANGYNGYLPTKAHHALGGYETWRARSSYLEVDAAEKITARALELLGALKASASERE